LLMNLRNVFQADYQRVEEYAQQLDEAMHAINLPDASKSHELSLDAIHGLIDNWSKYWDAEWGGNRKAPKFPMPNNWELLLNYAVFFKNENALRHVNDTLRKMAFGGLYDQLAGGFARYSVDAEWKVPHFEKMLYDNAQLVSLYAQAYRATGDNLFKRVAEETLSFVMTEWKTPEGLYYSALDADSEGVEGKYYVWGEDEFNTILGEESALLKAYFGVGNHGYWEHGVSVLCIRHEEEEWCRLNNLNAHDWNKKLESAKEKLHAYRLKRIKPGLDDKCITSWNALLVKGFAEASKMRGQEHIIVHAENLIDALCEHLRLPSGLFAHTRTKGVSSKIV
ncbi:MAG: thioredoxin domain-containing protein, partial [Flavobacteriales bacterium]